MEFERERKRKRKSTGEKRHPRMSDNELMTKLVALRIPDDRRAKLLEKLSKKSCSAIAQHQFFDNLNQKAYGTLCQLTMNTLSCLLLARGQNHGNTHKLDMAIRLCDGSDIDNSALEDEQDGRKRRRSTSQKTTKPSKLAYDYCENMSFTESDMMRLFLAIASDYCKFAVLRWKGDVETANDIATIGAVPTKNDGSVFVGGANTKNNTANDPWKTIARKFRDPTFKPLNPLDSKEGPGPCSLDLFGKVVAIPPQKGDGPPLSKKMMKKRSPNFTLNGLAINYGGQGSEGVVDPDLVEDEERKDAADFDNSLASLDPSTTSWGGTSKSTRFQKKWLCNMWLSLIRGYELTCAGYFNSLKVQASNNRKKGMAPPVPGAPGSSDKLEPRFKFCDAETGVTNLGQVLMVYMALQSDYNKMLVEVSSKVLDKRLLANELSGPSGEGFTGPTMISAGAADPSAGLFGKERLFIEKERFKMEKRTHEIATLTSLHELKNVSDAETTARFNKFIDVLEARVIDSLANEYTPEDLEDDEEDEEEE